MLHRDDPAAGAAALIRDHYVKVYAYLIWMGADRPTAEDLTHDTYTRAWRSIDRLRHASSARAWLIRIARNEYLQHRRRNHPIATDPGTLDTLPSPGVDLLKQIEDSDRDQRLRAAVLTLERELIEIVVLHYFQDLKLREIATLLEIPAGTVKSRMNRALERLRASLGKEEDHVRERCREAAAKTR
ncbi:MAG: RNA polymerase sigma factor [Candidatus Eisenbacteria bacterium]|nr:RNA polymerase sigma factor [Candidatus Eisenbacteria bacterium]